MLFSCIYVICVPLHVCHACSLHVYHVYLPLCIQFMSLSCMSPFMHVTYVLLQVCHMCLSVCMLHLFPFMYVMCPLHVCPLHACHVCLLHVCHVCLPLGMLHVFSFMYVMSPPLGMLYVSPFMYVMCVPLPFPLVFFLSVGFVFVF